MDADQAMKFISEYASRVGKGDNTVVDNLKGLYKELEPLLKTAGMTLSDEQINSLNTDSLQKFFSNGANVKNNLEPALKAYAALSPFLQGK